jgi:hypothetical protein
MARKKSIMSELGTMLAAGTMAGARQAEARDTGRLASPADLARQAVALLRRRPASGGRGCRWVALPA